MRTVNRPVNVVKTFEATEVGVKEEFVMRNDLPLQKSYTVTIRLYSNIDELIEESTINITGQDYDYLMSDSSDFSVGKIKGDCREEDVWKVVDKIRERTLDGVVDAPK